MPIIVACPRCGTRLSAPESAAGKHVKCPKPGCGTIAEVPEFVAAEEVPVVEATLTQPEPKPKRRDEDDDGQPRKRSRRDETEDEDDRPATRRERRRDDDDDDYEFDHRRRRRRKSGMGAGAIVAIVLGGLVVLGGVGVGVYALASKKSGSDADSGSGPGSARRTSPPAGWQQFTFPDDGFRAYFAQPPRVIKSSDGQFDFPPIAGRRPESFTLYLAPQKGPGTVAEVVVLRFIASHPLDRDALIYQLRKQNGEVEDRPVTWLGHSGYEVTAQRGQVAARIVLIDKTLYMATLASLSAPVTAQEKSGFFDNFELLK
jgi:hypothetical protein